MKWIYWLIGCLMFFDLSAVCSRIMAENINSKRVTRNLLIINPLHKWLGCLLNWMYVNTLNNYDNCGVNKNIINPNCTCTLFLYYTFYFKWVGAGSTINIAGETLASINSEIGSSLTVAASSLNHLMTDQLHIDGITDISASLVDGTKDALQSVGSSVTDVANSISHAISSGVGSIGHSISR